MTTCTEMTVESAIKGWCTMPDDTKEWVAKRLMAALCPVSHATVMEFQRDWDGSKPFDEFQVAQQAMFLQCASVEASEVGKVVRHATDTPGDFSMDMVLKQHEDPSVEETDDSVA